MPSLGWNVTGQIYVADARPEKYLLVNRETGAWAVSNTSGIYALQIAGCGYSSPLPPDCGCLLRKPAAHRIHGRLEPLIIIYKLTNKCDYRCVYCYDRVVARQKNPARRSAAIRALLDRIYPHRPVMVLFHGGEPLLEFDEIRDIVLAYEKLTPSQILYSLQTNVRCLDQQKLDFLVQHRVGISVSLDGHDSDMNRLRMAERSPEPYSLLKGMLRDLHGFRADHMGLLVTVGKHNVGRLIEALLAFQADGFRCVSFSFMHDVGAGAKCADPRELIDLMVGIARAIVQKKIESLACMTLIQWVMRIAFMRSGLVCLASPCGAGNTVATVSADGAIGPCDSMFSDEYFYEDVDEYLRALEAEPLLQRLRERNVNALSPCLSCDVKAHCNGTCPGSAMLNTGEIHVDPHECAFYYGMIRELLWLLCEPEAGTRLVQYCKRHLAEKKAYGI